MNERRTNPTKADEELYKLKDIDVFIEKERRHDELDRLLEVQGQKRVWRMTFYACTTAIVVLIALATWGVLQR